MVNFSVIRDPTDSACIDADGLLHGSGGQTSIIGGDVRIDPDVSTNIDTEKIFQDINNSISGAVHDWVVNQAVNVFAAFISDPGYDPDGESGERNDPSRTNGALMAGRIMASRAFRTVWVSFVQPVIQFFAYIIGYVLWFLRFAVDNLFSWMKFTIYQPRPQQHQDGVSSDEDSGTTAATATATAADSPPENRDLVSSMNDVPTVVLSYVIFACLLILWIWLLKRIVRIYRCKRKVD
jgi:hypothetical protein